MKKLFSVFLVCFWGILFLPGSSIEATIGAEGEITYTVAIDKEYAPYEYVDLDGEIKGFTPDLLREIGLSIGVHFHFVPMNWPEAVAGLEKGDVDLLNMIRSPDRMDQYEFSAPHSFIKQAIFRHVSAHGITSLKTLSGHRVALQEDDISMEKMAGRDDFILHTVRDKAEGFLLLNAGKVDAFIAAELAGMRLIREYHLTEVVPAIVGLFPQDFCFAAQRGNRELISLLNTGLQQLKKSGRYEQLFRKWLALPMAESSWLARNWRTFAILATLFFFVLLGFFVWNIMLRRAVSLRTKALNKGRAALHQANRKLKAISDCNQVLMRTTDERILLSEICRIVCREAGYRIAWVGYAEQDPGKSIRPIAWAGADVEHVENTKFSWSDETELGRGPTGQAVRSGKTVRLTDLNTDPRLGPWRKLILAYQLKSGMVLPLKDEKDTPFGVLCIYSTEPDIASDEEIELMEELAGDLAFGITVVRNRARQKETKHENTMLRLALDRVHEAVYLIDAHGRFRYVNEESCRALGFDRFELLRQTVGDIDPAFPAERWNEHWHELKNKGSLTFEAHHRNKDGRLSPVEIHANYFEFEDSGFNLALVRDISERKRLESERHANLHFLKTLDNINRAVQRAEDLESMTGRVLDAVLDIFDCDRAFLMYPCDPEAKTWKVPMERNKPEYPGVSELGLEMQMDQDVAVTLRILLDASGPVQFGPGTDHPLPDEVSKQFGFKNFMSMAIYPKYGNSWQFGIHQCSHIRQWTPEEVRLFTEIGRRLADALTTRLILSDLQQSEERYRTVFENSPISIWEEDFSQIQIYFNKLRNQGITNLEAYSHLHPELVNHCADMVRIVDVNKAAVALYGADNKEELLIETLNTFTPETFETFRQQLICLWNGEKEMTHDSLVKTLAGNRLQVALFLTVCPGFEATLGKVIISLIDTTDRKQAEMDLKQLNIELERRVHERTGELETKSRQLLESRAALMNLVEDLNEQSIELEEANRKLLSLDRLKSMFIASMSHELRTPLNSIIGFSAILLDEWVGPLNDKQKEDLATVQRAGQHLLSLINDVIDVSKIEAGTLDSHKEHFALEELVNEAVNLMKKDIEEKRLRLEVNIGSFELFTDRRRLLQCLLNLLSNACKFTESGVICITSERLSVADPAGQDRLQLKVSDTGIGIAPEDQPRLFTPFFRIMSPLSPKVKGTGLGLYLIKMICRKILQGEVGVESEVGKGSSFFLNIPFSTMEEEELNENSTGD